MAKEICPPALSLAQASWMHFIHDGSVFSVKRCLTWRFQSAIREKHPGRFGDDRTNYLMDEEELDLVSRWYLLCELASLNCPIELFQTRMMALYSLRARIVSGSVQER